MMCARSRSFVLFVIIAIIACLTRHTTLAQQQNVVGGKFVTRTKLTTTTSTKKKRSLLFWRKKDDVAIGKSVFRSMKVVNVDDENYSEEWNILNDEAIMFMKAVLVSIFLAFLPLIQRRLERVGEDLATNQSTDEGGGEFQFNLSCTCPPSLSSFCFEIQFFFHLVWLYLLFLYCLDCLLTQIHISRIH